jgi:hypothetical protein
MHDELGRRLCPNQYLDCSTSKTRLVGHHRIEVHVDYDLLEVGVVERIA